jgi:hypothetical protein
VIKEGRDRRVGGRTSSSESSGPARLGASLSAGRLRDGRGAGQYKSMFITYLSRSLARSLSPFLLSLSISLSLSRSASRIPGTSLSLSLARSAAASIPPADADAPWFFRRRCRRRRPAGGRSGGPVVVVGASGRHLEPAEKGGGE